MGRAPWTDASDLAPVSSALRGFLSERQPTGVGWPHALGSLVIGFLALQTVTGILLAFYYAPATDVAWESIRFIEEEVTFGSLLRGLHHYGASAFVIVLVLHMTQAFLYGAYKAPRRLLWTAGVLLLLVGLGFGYTGYLLPWDLKAWFGTQVGTAIPGSVPVVGPHLLRWLRGGEELGQLTLSRFYAMHVLLLPAAAVVLVGLHLFLVRALGVTPPWRRRGEGEAHSERQGEPFHPYQLARDSVVVAVGLGLVAVLAATGAPLERKADPLVTDYVPAPEWYFLGLQHLLRLLPGDLQLLGSLVVPGAAVLFLLGIPFLDRSPDRMLSRRKAIVAAYLGGLAAATWLTWAGYAAVEEERERLAGLRREALAGVEPAAPEEREEEAAVDRGRELYEALRCGGCHPDEGPPVGFAPALGLEGSRVLRSWLGRYLLEPHRIHWEEDDRRPDARMPDFLLTEEEASALADFLMTRTDQETVPPGRVRRDELTDEAAARGEELMVDLFCLDCHQSGEAGGRLGPDLTHVGARLQPDYMVAVIEAPERVNPETKMDNLGLEPDEIRDLVAYLVRRR